MRCGALGRLGIRSVVGGDGGAVVMSLQNIRVQLSGILTGTGVHELNADILCVLAGAKVVEKMGFAGERSEEMGEYILFVRVGGLSRVGDARRPGGKVCITG